MTRFQHHSFWIFSTERIRLARTVNKSIMMRPIRWNRNTIGVAVLLVVVIYWISSASKNTFETEQVLPHVQPASVWNFVADFSNMPLLNPTM